MAKAKTPERVNGIARPESEVSQMLGHVPHICASLGRGWTVVVVLTALLTGCRWQLSCAAALLIALRFLLT